MIYKNIRPAVFLERPTRFLARVRWDGTDTTVHVKNTGRCGELLLPGARVYLEDFTGRMGSRKLAYSLIAVEKQRENAPPLLVNMDAQAPNQVTKEALLSGALSLPRMGRLEIVKPETVCGNSRLDFFVRDEAGQEGYLEVKGVTLEHDGVASFPDAPTERGIKHLWELSELAGQGVRAYVLFVVQMEQMHVFRPNAERHPAFAEALREAVSRGVTALAYDCLVTPNTLALHAPVPIRLE